MRVHEEILVHRYVELVSSRGAEQASNRQAASKAVETYVADLSCRSAKRSVNRAVNRAVAAAADRMRDLKKAHDDRMREHEERMREHQVRMQEHRESMLAFMRGQNMQNQHQ